MENSHVLENFTTKERSTNFSKAEVDKLQSLVGKYKHILLCKKTDGTSSKQKENVWNNISKEFNAVGETPRSVKQLKYKFDNLKRAIKKEASSKRQSMLKTGGGRLTPSLPPSQDDEETTDWLKSIMSTSIDGNDAIYDDDVIKPHEDENIKLDIITIKNSNTPIAKVAESKTAEPAGIDAEIVFDTSTPHSSLKRPMSSPLKCRAKRRREVVSCNLIKKALQEKKLNVLDELHDMELQKIKQTIEQQKELHEQKLRHNEEKHKLEIIKLQLEIDLLNNK